MSTGGAATSGGTFAGSGGVSNGAGGTFTGSTGSSKAGGGTGNSTVATSDAGTSSTFGTSGGASNPAGGTSAGTGFGSGGRITGTGGANAGGGMTSTASSIGSGGRSTGAGGTKTTSVTLASGGGSVGGVSGTGGTKGTTTATAGAGTGAKISGTGGTTTTGGASSNGGTSSGGIASTGGTSSSCPKGTHTTAGTKYCSNTRNDSGAYSYELWAEGDGSGCMTFYGVTGTFSATWSNVDDFLARTGLRFDQTKTPSQIGTITADFAETKTSESGLVYVGIYGWTISPLREYYIIDDWGSAKPAELAPDGSARTHIGTITVDGDDYDVWKNTRVNKPNITGTDATFDQYFSVRTNARQCGHVSVSQHFSEWTKLGLQLGNLEEATLLLEAQNGTGTIDFTTATVAIK